jgi:hypothetical protein
MERERGRARRGRDAADQRAGNHEKSPSGLVVV